MSWDENLAAADLAVADYFDQGACTLLPTAPGPTANYKRGPDPNRQPFDFLATIELEPPSDRIARHLSSDTGIRNGTVSYDAVMTALISSWPYLPQRDDQVAVDGVAAWKIVAKEQDGSLRPAWYLARI